MGSKQNIHEKDDRIQEDVRLVPTEEEMAESRRSVEKVQKESRLFTRADFEIVLKATTKPSKQEQGEKESVRT